MGIFGTCHHLRCRVCTAGTDADYFGGFLGSTFVLKYIVDYDRMHAGNNYAKITFSSVYETKVLEIYAHKGENKSPKNKKNMPKSGNVSPGW